MTREYEGLNQREEQERGPRGRSRAGLLGSVVALGLSHARLSMTVLGRVPLVMLNSVQTIAEKGFAPAHPHELDDLDMTPGAQPRPRARANRVAHDLQQEFRIRDVARNLNRDLRPGHVSVRGTASDLMNTVAKLHRDYAVVVSNFSDVISAAIENFTIDGRSPADDEELSHYPPGGRANGQDEPVPVRPPTRFQSVKVQPARTVKKPERE